MKNYAPLLALFLIFGCQSQPSKRQPTSLTLDQYSALSQLMGARGKVSRAKFKGCDKISFNRDAFTGVVKIKVDGETYTFLTRKNDRLKVISENHQKYAFVKNESIDLVESPLDFSECSDCYKKNEYTSFMIYPPPYYAGKIIRFALSEYRDGKIQKSVECWAKDS